MAGVLGLERYQPTRFPKACLIVRYMITEVGDEEYEKSKSRCFIKGDGTQKVIDSLSTPIEDILLLSERAKFGRIIVANHPNGSGFTMI